MSPLALLSLLSIAVAILLAVVIWLQLASERRAREARERHERAVAEIVASARRQAAAAADDGVGSWLLATPDLKGPTSGTPDVGSFLP